ncbi:Protein kinase superfamily protein [Zea mays]|uniref:Protein kinase superfamily protein n=1 Tax=Zea mays TaxID=4577 RepID=A0A1D6Q7J7_MAIZE|nr:Protein kinase superfamily protein [Zea mays]
MQSVAEMASNAYRKPSVSPSATMLKALPMRFLASPEPGGWSRRLPRRSLRSVSAALMTNPAYFEVGRFLGGYGFMNITSYSSSQFGEPSNVAGIQDLGLGYSPEEIERLRVQDIGEGEVTIRLYEGRVVQGPFRGTRAVFKVYPGARADASEADLMALNELRTHAFLQSDASDICENIQFLLGAFETATGEQWLAFRDDGRYSAADYANVTSARQLKEKSGGTPFWNPFDRAYKLELRRYFVLKLLNGAMSGLVHMHNHDRLHQSLGPSSVILKYSSIGAGVLSDGLWRRASAAGASTPLEKRAFGIADDMQMISHDIQTHMLINFQISYRYCLADDQLSEAAMLNPDYRKRPIAEAVLNHRFITGAVLRNY